MKRRNLLHASCTTLMTSMPDVATSLMAEVNFGVVLTDGIHKSAVSSSQGTQATIHRTTIATQCTLEFLTTAGCQTEEMFRGRAWRRSTTSGTTFSKTSFASPMAPHLHLRFELTAAPPLHLGAPEARQRPEGQPKRLETTLPIASLSFHRWRKTGTAAPALTPPAMLRKHPQGFSL
ncbi:uncharacterized protein LOC144158902 isoform X4 [Haemaphysalis longicornis]